MVTYSAPKQMTARFGGTCPACKGPIAAGETILWNGTARHANSIVCSALKAEYDRPVQEAANLLSIADFLNAAKANGLKYPKVRFQHGEVVIRLTLGWKGAINVMRERGHSETWLGRITPDGNVDAGIHRNESLMARLSEIGVNPALAAREYASLTGNCSFCAKALTDEGSIEVGYGPVCAKKYGLPHEAKGTRMATAY